MVLYLGFGDLVAGVNAIMANQAAKGSLNLLIAFIYFFLGMALLAMCFALMQEEFREKIQLIVTKLGIHDDQKEEEEEEEEEEEVIAIDSIQQQQQQHKEHSNDYKYQDQRETVSAQSSAPPHYDNSALDLRFEKEPTVISVKPTLETYDHSEDSAAANKEPSFLYKEPSNLMPKSDAQPVSVAREKSSLLAFKRESTNFHQKKKELDTEMTNMKSVTYNTNYAFDEESQS